MEAYNSCTEFFRGRSVKVDSSLDARELKEYLEALGKEVIEKFENSDVSCPIKTFTNLKKKLEVEIEEMEKKTLKDFENQELIDDKKFRAVFDESMSILLENVVNNQHVLEVDVKQRENRLTEFQNEALKYFNDETKRMKNLRLKDKYTQSFLDSISSKVNDELQKFLKMDNEKKSNAVRACTKICIEKYKSSIQNAIDNCRWDSTKLLSLHEELRDAGKIEFEQICTTNTIQVDQSLIKNFLTEIDSEFEKIEADFQREETKLRENLETSMKEMCEIYESSIRRKFPRDLVLDEGKLLSFHNWRKAELIEKFKIFKTSENENLYKEFQIKLKNQIESFYFEFLNVANQTHTSKVQELNATFQKIASDFEKEFEHKIKSFPKDESIPKCNQIANKFINNSVVQFKLKTEPLDHDLSNKFEEALKITLNCLLDHELKNRSYEEELQKQQLPVAKQAAEKMYNVTMKKFLTASRNYNELQEFHHEVRTRLLHKYQCYSEYTRKELGAHIDLCFEAYGPLNAMNISNRQLTMGIDLGTTNCCVAVYRNRIVEVVRDEKGDYITPSYVAIVEGNPVPIIGKPALENSEVYLDRTVFDCKRLMGKWYDDESVQRNIQDWPFDVMSHKDGLRIKIANNLYSPEHITSMILTYLKDVTANDIGDRITEAVITVPTEFNTSQRNATVEAGRLAGLTKIELLDEPNAAALAYFWNENILTPLTCLVFDFGGGTLDLSIVKYSNGNIEVIKTAGDKNLGGRDFDNNLVHFCFRKFKAATGIDVELNNRAKSTPALRSKYLSECARLRCKVEQAKIQLSTNPSATIDVDGVQGFNTGTGEQQIGDLSVKITRKEFETIPENQKIFKRVQAVLGETISSSSLRVGEIERVLLVGGSSHIPKIKSIIVEYFHDDSIVHDEQTPNQTVARGAAIYGAQLSGKQTEKGLCFSGSVPLSLGVGNFNGSITKIIDKGQKLPAKGSYIFYRKKEDVESNQPIEIYEGNSESVRENHLVYRFYLTDLVCEVGDDLEIHIKITVPNNKEFTIAATIDGITRKYFVTKGQADGSDLKKVYI